MYPQNKQLAICFANDSHVQLAMIFYSVLEKLLLKKILLRFIESSQENRAKIDKPARTFYASELIETFNPK